MKDIRYNFYWNIQSNYKNETMKQYKNEVVENIESVSVRHHKYNEYV